MGEVVRLNQPYWKSFRLPDGKMRWFYTDEKTKISIKDKEWFNKNTISICIHKGYETEEYSEIPISEMIYRIAIDYQIANYFGDKSGMHFRSKIYMLVGDKLYKQDKGEGIEVTRITKELKGALEELKAVMNYRFYGGFIYYTTNYYVYDIIAQKDWSDNMKIVFDMPELLLVGIGNEIIYDREQGTRKINLVDGMQRTHSDWGKIDIRKKLIEEVLNSGNNITVPQIFIDIMEVSK